MHPYLCECPKQAAPTLFCLDENKSINVREFQPALVSPFILGGLGSSGVALRDTFLSVRNMGTDSVLRPVNCLSTSKVKRREIGTKGQNCPVELSVTFHLSVKCYRNTTHFMCCI